MDAELLSIERLIGKRPAEAYSALQKLSPATDAQTQKRHMLLDQAGTDWLKQIEDRLKIATTANPINLNQVDEDIRALRVDLDKSETANLWETRLNGPRAAQKARNLGHQNATLIERKQAIQAWENAIRLADTSYVEHYRNELRDAEVALLHQQIDQPFSIPNDQKANALDLRRQHILEILANITNLQERYPDASLYQSAAEHYEQLAKMADDQRSRADYYEKMHNQAQGGIGHARSGTSEMPLRNLDTRAMKGQEVTRHMQDVLSLFQADQDLQSYQAAVNTWDSKISPITENAEFNHGFDYLNAWWLGLVETRLETLRNANKATGPIDISEIGNLARRHILDQNDARGALFYRQHLSLQQKIIDKSADLSERLPTGRGFTGGSYSARIEDARHTTSQTLEAGSDLKIIIQSALPQDALAPPQLPKALEHLQQVHNMFLKVVTAANQFEPVLKNDIANDDPELCHAEPVEFLPTRRVLENIPDDFTNHEGVIEMRTQLERAEKRRQTLLNNIYKIEDFASHERYQTAYHVMQNPAFRPDTLANNGLANCFQVIDPSSPGKVYQTYDDVKRFLERNGEALRRVIIWAEPFLEGDEQDPAYSGHLLIEKEERVGSAIRVFNWSDSLGGDPGGVS